MAALSLNSKALKKRNGEAYEAGSLSSLASSLDDSGKEIAFDRQGI